MILYYLIKTVAMSFALWVFSVILAKDLVNSEKYEFKSAIP